MIFYWVANWSLSRAQACVLLGNDAREMLDCIGGDLARVLEANPHVDRFAGYVTGSPEIKWTSAQIDEVRKTGRALLLIDQSNSNAPLRADAKYAKDVESGASLISTAVEVAKARHADKLDSTIYIEQSELAELENEIERAGLPRGRIVGYQYASPSSKPQTLVPGTGKTVEELNVDLSVVRPEWLPMPHAAAPAPAPVEKRWTVELDGGEHELQVEFEHVAAGWRVKSTELLPPPPGGLT